MLGYQVMFFDIMLKTSSHVVISDTELRTAPPLLDRLYEAPVLSRVAHQVPSDRQRRIKRPGEIVGRLRSRAEVVAAAASLTGAALIEFGGKTKSIDLRGIEVAEQDRVTPLVQFVQVGKLTALSVVPDGIAVGSGVVKDLGLRQGDVVHAAAPGGRPLALKVVAILEVGVPPIDKTRGYVLLRTGQTLLGRPDAIGRIEVRLRDPDSAIGAATSFERMFGYDAESWQETNANFLTLFANQNVVIGVVIGAILLVGGFGILAVLIMIVLQKQRDIAILRSVGLRRADVLAAFLLQGLTIAAVGGVLGDLMGKLVVWVIPRIPMPIEGIVKANSLPVHEDPRFYVLGALFALGLGTLAAFLPAWRASRVEPVQVLRGQIG
jgi:lipoprotein-releasing system permease protein